MKRQITLTPLGTVIFSNRNLMEKIRTQTHKKHLDI